MARQTKADLVAGLESANATIAALRAELKHEKENPHWRAEKDGEDIDADVNWEGLRKALSGHVGQEDIHEKLVDEAIAIVQMWDELADVAKDYCFEGVDGDTLDDALATYREFEAAGTSLDEIGVKLWRAGRVGCNVPNSEVIDAIERLAQ